MLCGFTAAQVNKAPPNKAPPNPTQPVSSGVPYSVSTAKRKPGKAKDAAKKKYNRENRSYIVVVRYDLLQLKNPQIAWYTTD